MKQAVISRVVFQSTRATLHSWLVLLVMLGIRMAAALAGLVPVLLAIAVTIRLVLIAPVDHVSGEADIAAAYRAVFSDPRMLFAVAGLLMAAQVLRFVLESLADAGLFGELAQAAKESRAAGVGGMIGMAPRFFGRVAALRVVYGFIDFAFVCASLGIAVLIAYAMLPWLESVSINGLAFAVSGLAALGISLLLFLRGLLALFATGVIAALVADDLPLTKALRAGVSYSARRGLGIISLLVFFGLVYAMMAAMGEIGDFVWLGIGQSLPDSRWPQILPQAWALTFLITAQWLWIAMIYAQLRLYLSTNSRIDKISGPVVEMPSLKKPSIGIISAESGTAIGIEDP